jgi:hypothetical protein
MNRIVLGILCGLAFGVIDVLMTVLAIIRREPQPCSCRLSPAVAPSAFWLPTFSLRMPAVLAGALLGLLISLPDAFALKA